jgi:non-heme chloroperoxidase
MVSIKDSSKKSAKLIKGDMEIYYRVGRTDLTATHQKEVNTDLLKFLRSVKQARKAA